MLKLILFFLLSLSLYAKTYNIHVVSDPVAESKAKEFIGKISLLSPFKELIDRSYIQINSSPTIVAKEKLKCVGGAYGIKRLAQCKGFKGRIKRRLSKNQDAVLIFTSTPDIGAGGTPVISSVTFPWTTMLHEFIHYFKFTDEYAYQASNSGLYCGYQDHKKTHNQFHRRFDNEFDSESDAVEFCLREIPWCSRVIAQGGSIGESLDNGNFKLGTKAPDFCPSYEIGIYEGGSCSNNPGLSFRPYFCPTSMGFPTWGQDNCTVNKRHELIFNHSAYVPQYYAEKLVEIIAEKTNRPIFKVSADENTLSGLIISKQNILSACYN